MTLPPSGTAIPAPGRKRFTSPSPRNERNRRRDLEIDDRLQPDTPHRLEIAGARNADDERGEDERRDDHLDQPEERIGERLDRHTRGRPHDADEDAKDKTEKNAGGRTEGHEADDRSARPPGDAPVITSVFYAAASSVH